MAGNESFLRKVVRFVANPATDWNELNSRQDDTREFDLEKSELKAMIERKRRNDFVRKREFDMLRRLRREGLSPEQLAALGGSSRLDDSEVRLPDGRPSQPAGVVKAKIDAIEQQMVGDGFAQSGGRRTATGGAGAPSASREALQARIEPPATGGARVAGDAVALPPLPPLPELELAPVAAPAPVQMAAGLPPLAPITLHQELSPVGGDFRIGHHDGIAAGAGAGFAAVEVNEVVHDPELDEPVIAFANADFDQCEHALQRLTAPDGSRFQHAETWLVLFDLYRATGQQQRFESLAVDYAQQFGWSAPQWYSLPKLVAEAVVEERAPTPSARGGKAEVGWVCPEQLDVDAVAQLRSQTLQMPLPWVFDWSALRRLEAEAAMQLSMLFRLWAGQSLAMRWIGGERLFTVLAEAAPTGVRDADPAYWLTRLDALRLANRADQFDEAAIDYCVTYEVSPPSWESARCQVQISRSGMSTRTPALSMISEVSTSFRESGHSEPGAGSAVEQAHVELSGQLVGDISPTLARLSGQLGKAPIVSVSCARLIRVDFIAAGDLLNWVLSKRSENRTVQFVDAHRLVALFFGAMGINEHAKVQPRKV